MAHFLTPFIGATVVVSVMLAAISAYGSPESLRLLRRWITEVRADLVSNIVQPGRFIPLERGTGVQHPRAPAQWSAGRPADGRPARPQGARHHPRRTRRILKNETGNFLLLESGSIQRQEAKSRDPNIVLFDRYAFDLSQISGGPQVIKYSVRERYLWQLLWPEADDTLDKEQPGQFRAEMHDRILAPIYPFAFVLIAFAFLGAPRTTRQSAAWSIAGVIMAVSGAAPDRLRQHRVRHQVRVRR